MCPHLITKNLEQELRNRVHYLGLIFKKPIPQQEILPFKQCNYLNAMEPDNLKDLLHYSQQHHLTQISPSLADKNVLFISYPATVSLIDTLFKMEPAFLVNYQVNFNSEFRADRTVSVTGSLPPLSAKPESFDAVFFPLASFYQKEFLHLFPYISQSLKNGGRAVISVIHPALELFLYNQNPASISKTQINFQTYFSSLKENNLYLEEILEGTVDKETKVFFKEPQYYEEFRGIPLVLFLRAVKFQK